MIQTTLTQLRTLKLPLSELAYSVELLNSIFARQVLRLLSLRFAKHCRM